MDPAAPRERARATALLIRAWFSGLRACFHTVRAIPMAAALLMIFMSTTYPPKEHSRVALVTSRRRPARGHL